MAEVAKRPPPKDPLEEEVEDPKGALQRLASLTGRVMDVPKGEVPALFTRPKKKRRKKKA